MTDCATHCSNICPGLSKFTDGPQALSRMVAAIANESVPIQLAQCCFPGLAISNAKIMFSDKIYGSIFLSNNTRKLLMLEISVNTAYCT